jgi:hypothetical protein
MTDADGMTVLRFPSDRAVGTLDWDGSWSAETGPVLARGDVRVPDGAAVHLHVQEVLDSVASGRGGWRSTGGLRPVDLAVLTGLPSNALHAVTLRAVDERSVGALAHVSPGLRMLYLSASGLGDAVLPTVATLTGLTWLQAWGNRFTDAGVQQLVALQQLRHLYLEEETLTAAAFGFVENLPHLEQLGVQDVDLDDAELASLRSRLPRVRVGR